jgi:hypothetical protein
MSAPLQRLPECTLAAIVATAVVFALNTAPSGYGLRSPVASANAKVLGAGPPSSASDPALLVDSSVPMNAGGAPGNTKRTTGNTPESASLDGAKSEGLGTDIRNQGKLEYSNIQFADGGLEARGLLRNGQRFGHWHLYRDGSDSLLAEGGYAGDMRDGKWTRYHENGVVETQGGYATDLREGRWEHFDERGILILEEEYTGGLRDGLWRRMYSDGSVREEGHYVRGRREGQWIFRTPNGMLTRQSGFYEFGLKVSD